MQLHAKQAVHLRSRSALPSRRTAVKVAATGPKVDRRAAVGALVATAFGSLLPPSCRADLLPAVIIPDMAPDPTKFDITDERLRLASNMLQEALNVEDVVKEEYMWTRIIQDFGGVDEVWVPEVLGRAYGNRGNARSRQGKMEAAIADYEQAMKLCPWSVDPVLNRGVVLESMGRYDEAVTDYRAIIKVAPGDPAAWNNLGNACAGLGNYKDAETYYQKAMFMAPGFSFAAANHAVMVYQLGNSDEAIREMRTLLRKYPSFADMRAALAAALWSQGLEGQAEENWDRVDDPRYKSINWVASNRRWPPRLVKALDDLVNLRSATA